MPKCKNDSKKTYKGTEPSPKGLGFCAHSEKTNTKRKGKDGNIWVVKQIKTGSKRWVKEKTEDTHLDCSKFVRYEKHNSKTRSTKMLDGLEIRKGYIHTEIGINEFENEETKIPKGYKKARLNKKFYKEWLGKYHCNEKRELLTKDNDLYKKIKSSLSAKTKIYFIHDNGGRPFIVYITQKSPSSYKVSIYGNDKEIFYTRESDWYTNLLKNRWMYVKHIGTYTSQKVWIAKGYNWDWIGRKIPSLALDGQDMWYHKMFDGNSILLQITKDKYVFIGLTIVEFKLVKGDTIANFYSVVGGNDVPYPVVIGTKNVYFMFDFKYVPVDKFPSFTKRDQLNAYLHFYGQSKIGKPLEKDAKKMVGVKILQKRDW